MTELVAGAYSKGFSEPGKVHEALALCACAPHLMGRLLHMTIQSHGVLPQVLIPDIRAEIASDEKIKLLLSLGSIGSLLKDLFADDGAITDELRTSSRELVARGLGEPSQALQVGFYWDGFQTLVDKPRSSPESSFKLADMLPKWIAIFQYPQLWEDFTGMGSYDAGLQLHLSLQTLSEWKYLYGIDRSSDGSVFGGLTRDVDKPMGSSNLTAYNPREQPNEVRFLSGSYQIAYPKKTMVDLALAGGETWQAAGEQVPLVEQAYFWFAGALAFGRLRTENRAATASLYQGTKPVLPDEAFQLPLAMLPAMERLLSKRFTDGDARKVFASTDLKNPAQTEADLAQLAALALALNQWVSELSDLEASGLPKEDIHDLTRGAPELRKGLRFLVQNALAMSAREQLSIEQMARMVHLLARVERTTLESPLIRSRLTALMDNLVTALNETAGDWQGVDLLWVHGALLEIGRGKMAPQYPWLPKALSVFDQEASRL